VAAPTIAADQAAGVKVERHPWPGNAEGIRKHTIPTAAKFVRDGMHTPSVRALAGQILRDAGFPEGVRERAEAIRKHVKSCTSYAPDPQLSEFVQSAVKTLCIDEGDGALCSPLVDCDDAMVACQALIGAAGMSAFLMLLDYGPGIQPHVMGAVKDEQGRALEVDVTTDHGVGHVSYARKKTLVDPLDPSVAPTDHPGGSFIGVGLPGEPMHDITPSLESVGAGVWATDVDAAIATLDPSMTSLNTAMGLCTAVSTANQTLWQAAYAKWQQVKSDWLFDQSGSVAPGPVYGTAILQRVQESTNDYATFQSIAAQACPPSSGGAVPPPISPIVNPGGGGNKLGVPDWGDQVVQATKAVGILALVGVGAYALYKTVELASTFVGKKKR
jgi:hypothetical protein